MQLALNFAPVPVRDHGLRAAHIYPHVGRKTRNGFWSDHVPASHAWAYPYINTADACTTWATLSYDCDDREAMADGLMQLPPPNWMVRTRRGAHVTWCLASPVGKHQAARAAPLRLLSRTSEYYHHALGADPSFGGLGRNPAHPEADTLWGRGAPYELCDLGTVLPFRWKLPQIIHTLVGRNHDLFTATCRGASANKDVPALTIAHGLNAAVANEHGKPPLGDNEVASIARSVERYREGWRHGHAPWWRARQAARARKGKGRVIRGLMRASSDPDRGPDCLLKPWELVGCSRATWYRRRRADSETYANTGNTPEGGHAGPKPSYLLGLGSKNVSWSKGTGYEPDEAVGP